MDKNELISSMLSFKDNIGMWKIVLNQITDADFVIGYGFDNNERGMKAEWTFENEEEALEKLYKKVKFQYKIINQSVASVEKNTTAWNIGDRYLRSREHKSRSCDGEMEWSGMVRDILDERNEANVVVFCAENIRKYF